MKKKASEFFVSANFRDYAKRLRPMLTKGLTSHLAHLMGDFKLSQSTGKTKIIMGGKRIRGSLLCLVTATLGGTLESALSRAMAVELIQTATLIHDDFVDQHKLRRNCSTLWTVEGPRRAVLLGDIIFGSAIQMMSELGKEDCLIVSRAIAEVSLGAYHEFLNPSSLLEESEEDWKYAASYRKIIHLKTGILFGAACQLGAVAAKADDAIQQKWHRYGVKIGEAYQIADDLQEIERYLLTRSITASEISSLAQPLLFFNGEIRPYILEALRQKALALKGGLLEHFLLAADRMKVEIETLLDSAVSEVNGVSSENEYIHLARKAPWDIIQMFNEETHIS